MQRVPSRSTQPEFRPRRTAISAEIAVRGPKFRSQIPVLDRGFGRKPGAPTGVPGVTDRGSRSGGAETTVVRIGLSTRPSRNPGEPGARIFPRSQPAERKPGCDLLQHGTAGAVAHAFGPPTLSVEKPLVGKISAALPRDGRESRRRETGDHMPGRRCLHDFAGGAVVKMPSL